MATAQTSVEAAQHELKLLVERPLPGLDQRIGAYVVVDSVRAAFARLPPASSFLVVTSEPAPVSEPTPLSGSSSSSSSSSSASSSSQVKEKEEKSASGRSDGKEARDTRGTKRKRRDAANDAGRWSSRVRVALEIKRVAGPESLVRACVPLATAYLVNEAAGARVVEPLDALPRTEVRFVPDTHAVAALRGQRTLWLREGERLARHEPLCAYEGLLLPETERHQWLGLGQLLTFDRYSLLLRSRLPGLGTLFIGGQEPFGNTSAMINDAAPDGDDGDAEEQNNLAFGELLANGRPLAIVYALRDLEGPCELTVSYGSDYWGSIAILQDLDDDLRDRVARARSHLDAASAALSPSP